MSTRSASVCELLRFSAYRIELYVVSSSTVPCTLCTRCIAQIGFGFAHQDASLDFHSSRCALLVMLSLDEHRELLKVIQLADIVKMYS